VFEPIPLILLALATFRLTRLITRDQITAPLRNRVWKRFPPSTQLGYLLTCDWCISIYVATLVVISYILVPSVMLIIFAGLSLSALTGIISTILDRN
jgi:hypothetical protein